MYTHMRCMRLWSPEALHSMRSTRNTVSLTVPVLLVLPTYYMLPIAATDACEQRPFTPTMSQPATVTMVSAAFHVKLHLVMSAVTHCGPRSFGPAHAERVHYVSLQCWAE